MNIYLFIGMFLLAEIAIWLGVFGMSKERGPWRVIAANFAVIFVNLFLTLVIDIIRIIRL